MDWVVALQTAAGISSFLGLAAFVAVLYFWTEARKKESTLLGRLTGERIDGAQIVAILQQFKTDKARIEALANLMKGRENEAGPLFERIKKNIDPLRVQVLEARHRFSMFSVAAVVFLGLSAASLVGTRTDIVANKIAAPPGPGPSAQIRKTVVVCHGEHEARCRTNPFDVFEHCGDDNGVGGADPKVTGLRVCGNDNFDVLPAAGGSVGGNHCGYSWFKIACK
jgi:hypothetical protein